MDGSAFRRGDGQRHIIDDGSVIDPDRQANARSAGWRQRSRERIGTPSRVDGHQRIGQPGLEAGMEGVVRDDPGMHAAAVSPAGIDPACGRGS